MRQWPDCFQRRAQDLIVSGCEKAYRPVAAEHEPVYAEYYDKVLNITRGRIFSWGRIGDIVKMNTGQYDYLLEEYEATTKGKRFRDVIRKWRGPVG